MKRSQKKESQGQEQAENIERKIGSDAEILNQ